MSSNKKAGSSWKNTRHDKFYHLAKEQGYRSRAAFKLLQLNKKYNFLSSCKSCLDLCAAPGGWTQVAVKYMPVSSMIVSIDLLPMKSIRGATTLQCDITSQQCKSLVRRSLNGWDCDVILHDGAPNVGGGQSWSRDAYQQVELVIFALRLAVSFLRSGGTFVTKIFRSQDYSALLWVLQQFFTKVEVTKPSASRLASAEIFAVCLGYKKPKSVDPSLLDPNVIFQHDDSKDEKKKVNVFSATEKPKGVRSRSGYTTDKSIVFEQISVEEFISKGTDEAIAMLGTFNRLAFDVDDKGKALREHPNTTEEIRTLCEDLKVLGKGDFKALMKWREKIRRERRMKESEEEKERRMREHNEKGSEEEEDEEAKLTRELEEYETKMEMAKKKEKRKKREQKAKQSKRLETNVNNFSDGAELLSSTLDDGLFSLSSIPSADVLDEIEREGDVEIEDELSDDDDNNPSHRIGKDGDGDDEEDDDYVDRLEFELDRQFDQMRRKRLEMKKVGRARTAEDIVEAERAKRKLEVEESEDVPKVNDEEDDDADFFNSVARPVEDAGSKKRKRENKEEDEENEVFDSEDGIDDDESDVEEHPLSKIPSHPLLKSLGVNEEELANERWFDSPEFKEFREQAGIDTVGKAKPSKRSNGDNSNAIPSDSSGAAPSAKSSGKRSTDFDMLLTAHGDSNDEGSENGDVDEFDNDVDEESQSLDSEVEERSRMTKTREGYVQGISSMSKSRQQIEEEKKAEERKSKKRAAKERREQRKAAKGEAKSAKDSPFEYDAEGDILIPDLDSSKKAKKLARRARREAGESVGPTAPSKSSPSSFEEVKADDDNSDSDAPAQILAMGHQMLDKRKREEIVDNSYNRYSADLAELENLPDWFVQEESMYNKAELPVSKAEMASVKARLRALSEKPIKKILEARARNAHKTALKWEKLKQQAESIAKDDGTSEGLKMKEISKLFGKKHRMEKKERKYIVSRKGGGTQPVKASSKGGKVQVVRVDGRMKKDKRGKHAAERRTSQSRKTNNKRRKMS